MGDVFGWAAIAIVLLTPLVFAAVGIVTRFRPPDGEAGMSSSGGLLGIDEFFHPSAENARAAWEAEQVIPAPAPTPDRGPGVIEAGTRIVVEVPAGPHRPR